MSEKIDKNHEILFLYDAEMCNPNGDPDNENKPRMDYETERNLVSDVRLKRYIRDYLMEYKGLPIFICKLDGETVNATERLKRLAESQKVKLENLTNQEILSQLVDVRLFGATMPIKGEGRAGGSSRTFIGPVQFNWGYSLNKVSLCESSSITSHFSSEKGKEQGAMGRDYRVNYSLIAFHGIISAKRAEHTNLTKEDVSLLDEAMIKSIPLMATRSKIGQTPRFYIRVEYNSPEYLFGDMRKYLSLKMEEESAIRSYKDYELNFSELSKKLGEIKEKIKRIHCWKHPDFKIKGWNEDDMKANGIDIKPL